MNMEKILIFSVSFGHGHNQVSSVLQKELQVRGFNTEVVDTFEVINPLFHKVVLESYLYLLRMKPSLWGKIYHYSEENPNSIFLRQFNAFLTKRLHQFIELNRASVIITTHPIATTLVANVKRKMMLTSNLFALLTDFAVHPMSIHNEVDGYFIASDHLNYANTLYNLDGSLFHPTGIPVNHAKVHLQPREAIRRELNLNENMKTILIAGGGVGLANYSNILASLESFHENLQIICVTGQNKKALQKLERHNSKHSLHILGFTNRFINYLRASDVILTKAGGVTMAEALICETPALIYQPLPGQEEQNTQFLMNYGFAIKAEFPEEIPVLLEKIIFQKQYHDMMIENARKLRRPTATQEIASIIENVALNHQLKIQV